MPVPTKRDDFRDPQSNKFRVVKELERSGYVAEPDFAGRPGVTVYRHPVAPGLLVDNDGRTEVLSSEPKAQTVLGPEPKRIHWGRGLLFLVVLGGMTFLGLLVVAMVVG